MTAPILPSREQIAAALDRYRHPEPGVIEVRDELAEWATTIAAYRKSKGLGGILDDSRKHDVRGRA